MQDESGQQLMVSRAWVQAVAIVILFGFFVLGFLAYRTYTDEPPIPNRVVDPNGNVIFNHADIMGGQVVFLQNGLMEFGSIFGHGAYLGPDFTVDYLHRAALISIDEYGGPSSDVHLGNMPGCSSSRHSRFPRSACSGHPMRWHTRPLAGSLPSSRNITLIH